MIDISIEIVVHGFVVIKKCVVFLLHNSGLRLLVILNAVDNGADWIYTAPASNPDLAGDKITVQATDNPDNMAELTQNL